MALLDRYKQTTETPSKLLNQQQAIAAFDLFLQGKTIGEVRLLLCLNEDKVKTLYKRLVEVIDMMERIVKREARLVREEGHWENNDEGLEPIWVVDVEEEICPVPQTLEKLHERALQLVQSDYDVTEPLFDTDDITELVEGLFYVIDQVIINSSPNQSGTFDEWKELVVNNE